MAFTCFGVWRVRGGGRISGKFSPFPPPYWRASPQQVPFQPEADQEKEIQTPRNVHIGWGVVRKEEALYSQLCVSLWFLTPTPPPPHPSPSPTTSLRPIHPFLKACPELTGRAAASLPPHAREGAEGCLLLEGDMRIYLSGPQFPQL